MAIEKYVVIAGLQSAGGRFIERSWNGAAAGASVNDIDKKDAKAIYVNAESAAEAIRGARQLYPTVITDTVKAVLVSSMTEG
jgi:hypothetical protein